MNKQCVGIVTLLETLEEPNNATWVGMLPAYVKASCEAAVAKIRAVSTQVNEAIDNELGNMKALKSEMTSAINEAKEALRRANVQTTEAKAVAAM